MPVHPDKKEVLMKKAAIALIGAATFALGLTTVGFGSETESEWFPTYEQTASAWLDQGENEVRGTGDLTGGWSAEFAHGAVYLYDGKVDENAPANALGVTLEKEVFDEYVAGAPSQENYREFARSFSYTEEDGSTDYFFSVGPNAYFMISVMPGEDPDAVSSRFSVEPSDYTEDSVGE